jgi:acetylglutamate kinase
VTTVLKVGGASEDPGRLVASLAAGGVGVVLVHGGGPQISQACREAGLEPRFVDGQRVTDAAVLAVVERVLAMQNERLVASLQDAGVEAVGVSGVITATPAGDRRLGLVGEVAAVDVLPLRELLADGCVPVVNPFAGLNLNADHAAAAVAIAVAADELAFLSDVPGVLAADGSVIRTIAAGSSATLAAAGTIGGGMVPKLTAAGAALAGGVWRVWIGSETRVTA